MLVLRKFRQSLVIHSDFARVLCMFAVFFSCQFLTALHSPALASSPPKEEKKEEKKSEGGHGEKGGEGEGKDSLRSHYVKIPPLILPVIGDNGVEQIVSIIVLIEANSKESADSILETVPRLNDAFLTDLYGTLDRREKMRNGVIDVPFLKQRLTDLATKIVGPDKVKSLLIQGISQHPA